VAWLRLKPKVDESFDEMVEDDDFEQKYSTYQSLQTDGMPSIHQSLSEAIPTYIPYNACNRAREWVGWLSGEDN